MERELSEFVDTIYEDYQINRMGQVWSKKTNIILKPYLNQNLGYMCVCLRINKKSKNIYIHRLLGLTFLPNVNNLPQIDHIDRNKLNNDLSNLRWVTKAENSQNRDICLFPKGCIWLKRTTKNGKYYCAEFIYYKVRIRKYSYELNELTEWLEKQKKIRNIPYDNFILDVSKFDVSL